MSQLSADFEAYSAFWEHQKALDFGFWGTFPEEYLHSVSEELIGYFFFPDTDIIVGYEG
ncbi:hypothetical protein AYI69_g7586, partial [Smittium culicis]